MFGQNNGQRKMDLDYLERSTISSGRQNLNNGGSNRAGESSASGSRNLRELATKDIQFSQALISPTFMDGSLVSDLTSGLISGYVSVSMVPPIRVVQFRRAWVTLDNRRLRAFKDAMIEKIPVSVCELKDPDISKEFDSKRSNKTEEGGGIVRPSYQTSGSSQHFDEGIFVLTKKILNLTFEQLKMPSEKLQVISPLSSTFNSSAEYYRSFLDLILEEARATLQAGIEENIAGRGELPFRLVLQNYKSSKNRENPASLVFLKKIDERRTIKTNDAFILEYQEKESNVKLLALASHGPSEDSGRVSFKVVMEEHIELTYEKAFERDVEWSASPIGSIVTHLRMYDVCTACPQVSWLNQVMSGRLGNASGVLRFADDDYDAYSRNYGVTVGSYLSRETSIDDSSNASTRSYPEHLNEPQKQAIAGFLDLSEGLQLVQGPPGTGKTTMVVSLLRLLAEQGRVLVCAPSNKAVQVLTERFVSDYPDVPVMLAGVEDKLPEDNDKLNEIFLHTWGELKCEIIRGINDSLWNFLPNKLFFGKPEEIARKVDEAIQKMENIRENLNLLLRSFRKYRLKITGENEILVPKDAFSEYKNLINSKKIEISAANLTITLEQISDEQKIDKNLVKFFTEVRQRLSSITSFLMSMESKLRLLSKDDSINGLEMKLLNHSKIIFATLSVSGRKMLKEMSPVKALVVDEAGQALEAETLIPFACKPKKCLLIGDTKQLPATVISPEAAKLKFDRSMMYRLIEDCKQTYKMLTVQYRMHPEIRRWPSNQYYAGKLTDSEGIKQGRQVVGISTAPVFIAPYAFINVMGKEENSRYSFRNKNEADSIMTLLQFFKNKLKLDVVKQVGIITFYKAQVEFISEKVNRVFCGVKVSTVDSFQGDENDIIIISCVRSNLQGNIGFVNDFRRLNVALTRAKHSLIVMGHAETLEKRERDLALLVHDARDRECFFNYQEIEKQLAPEPILSGLQINVSRNQSSSSSFSSLQSKAGAGSNNNNVSNNNNNSSSFSAFSMLRDSKHKTELCRFHSNGFCRFGSNCSYAHSEFELRTASNYKNKGTDVVSLSEQYSKLMDLNGSTDKSRHKK